jgi:hypothetical protein
LAGDACGFTLLLPDVPEGLCEGFAGPPYTALADHYGGAACIQMALNACPSVAQRACHAQSDLYGDILLRNSEPLAWFSDPAGIAGTLSDPALAPCGHWVDYSNTDKAVALGKMLYYMRTQRYFTPVSIGTSEHWVDVIGYETDIEPPFSGTVTLQNIFFYDPLPGSPSLGWVSGNTWLGVPPGSTGYWADPLSLAGSAWNGKYLAIIEPPRASVVVKIPRWTRERPQPPEVVLESVRRWLEEIRERRVIPPGFELLGRDLEVRRPVLVKAEQPYYLVHFDDQRLAAAFSAGGSFEELRLFRQPRKGLVSGDAVVERAVKTVQERGLMVVERGRPELVFRPGLSPLGRVEPVWEVSLRMVGRSGEERRETLRADLGGEIQVGLGPLRPEPSRPRPNG